MIKRYLIHTKTSIDQARETCIKHGGVHILHCHKYFPFIVAEIENMKNLKNHPCISHIEEDVHIRVHKTHTHAGNQVALNVPWNIEVIKAPLVWPKSQGSGIRVGVLDTGIDYTHPALRGRVAGGYNIIAQNRNFRDDNGHGTHIAGTIASANARAGLFGVAPLASLYGIKVMDHNGSGRVSDTIKGIEWAIDNKIQVLNMSLGSSKYSQAFEQATRMAFQRGVIMVASAGNEGKRDRIVNNIDYPARFPWVISVGAVDRNMKRASFSSTGNRLDIMAPGVDIRSTWLGGGYKTESGTSMSAAHVSGSAALLMSLHPNMQSSMAKRYFMQLQSRMGALREYGHGVLNLTPLSRGR
ncbi:S8 family peptidase [Aneurinibacillus terranovensis]|uniref:S8 family peptidase n=1 Tax=Aneurinibacillus terranovensis TaxID=278991 RepID=UPI000410E136|nr:S8 family peptidase [Aneurinibacillus terranovensis]